MGLSSSKFSRSGSESKEKVQDKLSEDLRTPNGKTKIIQLDRELDPRSPTENIDRTPIQFASIPENGNNDKIVNDTPTRVHNPVKVLLAEDPRSPTTEYRRTPVVVGVIKKSPPMRIHNKNLDKALKGYNTVSSHSKIITDIDTPVKARTNVVPPKLLETSPVRIVNANAYKRKSCVGLLETNIDYTETDIDEVIMQKYHSPSIKKASSEPRIYNRISTLLKQEDIDPRSPTTDFKRTPIQILKKFNQLNANIVDCASSDEGVDANKTLAQNNEERTELIVNVEDKIDFLICADREKEITVKIADKMEHINESNCKQSKNYSELDVNIPDIIETSNIFSEIQREQEKQGSQTEQISNKIMPEIDNQVVVLDSEPSHKPLKISPEKPPRKFEKAISFNTDELILEDKQNRQRPNSHEVSDTCNMGIKATKEIKTKIDNKKILTNINEMQKEDILKTKSNDNRILKINQQDICQNTIITDRENLVPMAENTLQCMKQTQNPVNEKHITDNVYQEPTEAMCRDRENHTPIELENETIVTNTQQFLSSENQTNLTQDHHQKPINTMKSDRESYSSKVLKNETVMMNMKQSPIPEKINLTEDLKDFDKKLTNLIYEDSDVSILPPSMKTKDSSRTPLGVKNTITDSKKTARLKVSDKPRHNPEKVEGKGNSKIPLSQTRMKHNKKTAIQCENTPPRNLPGYNPRRASNMKPRAPQWDNDATLFI